MVEELLEPIPVEPRPAPEPRDFFQYRNVNSAHEDSLYASRDEALSKTSALNKRRLGDDPLLAQGSALNVRYTAQRRVSDLHRPSSPVPPASPASDRRQRAGSPGPQKRQSQYSQRLQSPPASPPLSATSKLNHRYSTTDSPPEDAKLAGSKLNQRYSVNGQVPNGHVPNRNMHYGDMGNEDMDLNRRYRHLTIDTILILCIISG